MNIKEYISSGILEQYVSGLISPQEKQEVECMSHIYPEIQTELDSLYQAFEAMALDMKMTPPAHLKANIMRSFSDLKAEEEKKAPVLTSQNDRPAEIQSPEKPGKQHTDNIRTMNTGWMRIAASILLIISIGLGYLLFDKHKNISLLQDEIALSKENLNKNEKAFAMLNKRVEVMSNADYQKVNLAGIPEKSASSSVSVYWNKKSSEVFIADIRLPEAPADKQYQLWAIADGKPVDMGMIGTDASLASLFQKMKDIPNPQAFAITLEKKGGVPSPTMTEMYVLGKI